MQCGNDCAIREREFSFAKGFDRNVVAQLGAHLFQAAPGQVIDGDQAPVTVSGRNFNAVNRGGLTIGVSRCRGDVCDAASQCCNCNRHGNNSFHSSSFTYGFSWYRKINEAVGTRLAAQR